MQSGGIRVGRLAVHPITDGTFVARPTYFDVEVPPGAHPEVFDRSGAAWLPVGCFVVQVGRRVLLVDAGLGPSWQQLPDDMLLVGGQLLTGLAALNVSTAQITDVVCTHLHADHVGWLFDLQARPTFPSAVIWGGSPDIDHFLEGPGDMAGHISSGLTDYQRGDRLRVLTRDRQIAPGVVARMAPGHTPGSLYVEIRSEQQRLLLVGDCITHPVQYAEPTWHSFGDVDPDAADRSRQRLWSEMGVAGTEGVGAHFPHLRPGHVGHGGWVPSAG